MQVDEYKIVFDSLKEHSWLSIISQECKKEIFEEQISLTFPVDVSMLKPMHITSLACFVRYLRDKGNKVTIEGDEEEFVNELLNYSHSTPNASYFGLWRIEEAWKDSKCIQITNFLKSMTSLRKKDLSAFQISLEEAFANVFDHAEANGNAYSFISFDEKNMRIEVAVCDFGVGIPKTIAGTIRVSVLDSIAIVNAMENGFSSKSREHNRGFGLANIRSACTDGDEFCVISRTGKVVVKGSEESIYKSLFDFPGTLLFYEISLENYDDEEIINEFEW